MQSEMIRAYPVRIIPFDLGRQINSSDNINLLNYICERFSQKNITPRQSSILKNCICTFEVNSYVAAYLYENGLLVVVIEECSLNLSSNYERFSITFINTENSGFTEIMHWERLKNSPEIDLIKEVEEEASYVIEKTIYSACIPQVMSNVKKESITEILVVGIDTDCCVLETAIDLFENNIRPIVMTKYCASNGGLDSHNAAIRVLERTIGREQLCDSFEV